MKDGKVRIKHGWGDAGKTGMQLADCVWCGQSWTPVLWDDEEDPDFHKTAGLDEIRINWVDAIPCREPDKEPGDGT